MCFLFVKAKYSENFYISIPVINFLLSGVATSILCKAHIGGVLLHFDMIAQYLCTVVNLISSICIDVVF